MASTVSYDEPNDLITVDNLDTDEAARRAGHFKKIDPFPRIAPALLSAEHICDYVRVTALIHPFYPATDRLKPASYEVHAKDIIRWEDDGRKVSTSLKEGDNYVLPANSISFVRIESKIRLPEYIALRFNLRIKHVHRGLLLGTGPLVDPTFYGDLLIPLHNLTSEDYELRASEGIIWIEFTKTSRAQTLQGEYTKSASQFRPIEPHKTDVSPEVYFEKANHNNPIQSSIPQAIRRAEEDARRAASSASKAQRANRFFAAIGFIAIASLVFGGANLSISVIRDLSDVRQEALKYKSEADASAREVDALKARVGQLESQRPIVSAPPSPKP